MNQSSIDWYYDQTVIYGKTNYAELLEQAKAMHEEEIKKAFTRGYSDSAQDCNGYDSDYSDRFGIDYYNKIYGNETK